MWRKILASVLEAELVTVNSTEGAAYGAARLAGVGAGAWLDIVSACDSVFRVTGRAEPDGVQQSVYRDSYATYRDLYPALQSSFQKM